MSDASAELTDSEIALLCDVGERDASGLSDDDKRNLERLLAAGYVEPLRKPSPSGFKLTRKGAAFLSERGAGLNES